MNGFESTRAIDKLIHIAESLGPDPASGIAVRRNGTVPNVWFVDAQAGSTSADGRDPRRPKKTLAPIIQSSSPLARSGDTIFVVGNITEEITASNLLEDITIVGVGNRPRHADKARDYATYPTYRGISGASWREAASHGATTPLLKIRGQGWHIENLLMVPPSDAAAIYLERNALSNISEYDASHLLVKDCRFAGGQSGIEDSGGQYGVRIERCKFLSNTNGIKSLSTAVDVATAWELVDNFFSSCTNSVLVSAKEWAVLRNVFGKFTTWSLNLIALSAQGDYNNVFGNTFAGDYDAKYIGGANDNWAGNYSMDTGSGEVGAEGLTTAAPVA